MWDRRVIFLSNIFSLFLGNKDQIEELHQEVGALESYGARILPILDLLFHKKGNLLGLEQSPDENLIHYFKDLGLSIPEYFVLPKKFGQTLKDRLKAHPAPTLTGFALDEKLGLLAKSINKKTLGTVEGYFRGNNKRLLHNFLKEKNRLTFDTFEAKNSDEVPKFLQEFRQRGYRFAVVKAQIGASGIGIKKIDLTDSSPETLPTYLFYEGPALVQGWLDEHIPSVKQIASPSILMFIDDHTCGFYDLTQQILSQQSVHEGNISPPPFLEDYPEAKDRLMEEAQIVGEWLKDQGYRGTASIDFHVITRKGSLEIRVCEINARVTGATYPSILAKHFLPQHTWLLRNIRFSTPQKSEDILDTLKEKNLLFLKGNSEGAMPFNFNTDQEGKVFKGQFLFLAKDAPNVTNLLETLIQTGAASGGLDRD